MYETDSYTNVSLAKSARTALRFPFFKTISRKPRN